MSGAFHYRPRFVDIRVRPPGADEARQADVYTLDADARVCDQAGCRRAADARAPKGRGAEGQFYAFCVPHAAEYNRDWDFFAGMSEAEIAAFQADASTGHRPTWSFKASNRSREAAAFADPLGVFSAARRRAEQAEAAAQRRALGGLERAALLDLDLDGAADGAAIRARYHALIKRLHPDSNGGDRSTEDKLGRVIRAYKTLKAAKLA